MSAKVFASTKYVVHIKQKLKLITLTLTVTDRFATQLCQYHRRILEETDLGSKLLID